MHSAELNFGEAAVLSGRLSQGASLLRIRLMNQSVFLTDTGAANCEQSRSRKQRQRWASHPSRDVSALRKQIEAMEEEKQQLAAKASQAGGLATDLGSLKAKVAELEKPWWKKWFLAGGE